MSTHLRNLLLDAYTWLFEQQGFSWRVWRELSVEMRRNGTGGYRAETAATAEALR